MAVRNTSIEIYKDMLEEGIISDRQAKVFDWLREFRENLGFWPTAAELSEYLDNKGVEGAGDPNFVRPRLTELKKELHLVDEDPRRSCFSRKSGHPNKISRYPSERPRVNREVSDVDWDSLMKKVKSGDLPKEEFKPEDHESEASGSEEEEVSEDDEKDQKDEDPVIVSGDETESEDSEEDGDEESEEKDDESYDCGDVIFGGEDDEEEADEEASSQEESRDEAETMTVDGEEYIFPPGKDEDDYDLDELDSSDGSQGHDEDQDQETERGKEQKEASLNQY